MKHWQIIGVLLVFLLISCAENRVAENVTIEQISADSQPENLSSPHYTLGVGDKIVFNVWRHGDLSRTIQIGPTGTIFIPLAGKFYVVGMTVSDLTQEVTERMAKYIVNPQVDINITDFRQNKIYVFGEINSPGVITFNLQNRMVFLEAISYAGGFTEDANPKKVLLIRSEQGTTKLVVLNIESIFKTGQLTQNLYLQHNDIVYVPKKRIANIQDFLSQLNNMLNPILSVERAIIMGPEVVKALTEDTEDQRDITISP